VRATPWAIAVGVRVGVTLGEKVGITVGDILVVTVWDATGITVREVSTKNRLDGLSAQSKQTHLPRSLRPLQR